MFSVILSVVGSIVAFLVVVVSVFTAVMGGGALGGDYYTGDNPWDQDVPASAQHEPGSNVWSGEGGVMIPLTTEDFAGGVLQVSLTQGALVELHLSDPEDVGKTDHGYPRYLEMIRPDDISVLIPTGDVTELWAMGNGAWELTMTPLTATEITDSYDGKGDQYLIYRGDALSARLTHKGAGIFFVSVFSATDRDMPIIETGEVDRRISWTPSTYTVFYIESDATRGAWSIEIDVLAKDVPAPAETPSNEPSPSPTP